MNALLLNGSPTEHPDADAVVRVIVDELTRRNCQVDHVVLRDARVSACMGEFGCWVKTPGVCMFKDDGRIITRKIVTSDLVVMLTPIIFGGYSWVLKKALDRSIGILSPFFTTINGEVHHRRRYRQYPSMVAVGTLSEPDDEAAAIFRTLVDRNALNMHNKAHAVSVLAGEQTDDTVRASVGEALAQVGVKA